MIRIEGADKLAVVARALRQLGDKDLRAGLYRGLNRATKKPKEDAKAEALARLPRRGGLNRRVAGSRLSTKRRAGRNPGVSIVASSSDSIRRIDRGTVRHPVYGNPEVWVAQPVEPGWFTDPMEDGADEARREVVQVLDGLAREIAKRVR